MRAESCKNRYVKKESFLTRDLRKAAKSLKNNKNIIIRKADKASICVILNKEEYHWKINDILSNTTKFVKINKDHTDSIKPKVNKLICYYLKYNYHGYNKKNSSCEILWIRILNN